MSDEDLLSNVDRISKILPTNEISEDIEELPRLSKLLDEDQLINSSNTQSPQNQIPLNMQHFQMSLIASQAKIKEQKHLIEQLKCEIQNKQTVVMIKESQMSLMQMKIEELEDELKKANAKSPQIEKIDQEVQVQIEVNKVERRKSKSGIVGDRKRQNSSGIKKTPTRVSEVSQQDQIEIAMYLKSHQFDTPQLKNDFNMKESPSTGGKRSLACLPQMIKQQNQSFTSEDVLVLRQQLQQLKMQLQRSEENNLMMQSKIEKQKSDKSSLKDKYHQTNFEKNELSKIIEKSEREQENLLRKVEGLKAEILDYKRQIDVLQIKQVEKNSVLKIERQTSNSSLQPIIIEQEIQTDLQLRTLESRQNQSSSLSKPPSRHTQVKSSTSSHHHTKQPSSHIQVLDEHRVLPHQIGTLEESSSSFSTQSLTQTNNNITIINKSKPHNDQLNTLLEKAKDYEAISMKLQQEINEHKKLLRVNQAKSDEIGIKELKKKVKRREQKIDKYRTRCKGLEKEVQELRSKLEQHRQKMQDQKLKMESKLQEKDFKILTLKNQMKYFPMSSGINTPLGNTQTPSQNLVNQNDLYKVINQMVKQSFQQNSMSQTKAWVRAKSQEQPIYQVATSFYGDNLFDEPRIMIPHQITTTIGENNHSFTNFTPHQDHHQHSNLSVMNHHKTNMSHQIYQQSPHNQYPSSRQKRTITEAECKPVFDRSKQFLSHPDLESRQSPSDYQSQNFQQAAKNAMITQPKVTRPHHTRHRVLSQEFQHQNDFSNNQGINYTQLGAFYYEDSLQTEPLKQALRHPDLRNEIHIPADEAVDHSLIQVDIQQDQSSSMAISRFVENKIEELRQKRMVDQHKYAKVKQKIKGEKQVMTQQRNSPLKDQDHIEFYNIGQTPFINTQTVMSGEKHQNMSLLNDIKPEHSNLSNTSVLNRTISYQASQLNQTNTFNPTRVKEVILLASPNDKGSATVCNSLNESQRMNHFRLTSKIQRDTDLVETIQEQQNHQSSDREYYNQVMNELQNAGRHHTIIQVQSPQHEKFSSDNRKIQDQANFSQRNEVRSHNNKTDNDKMVYALSSLKLDFESMGQPTSGDNASITMSNENHSQRQSQLPLYKNEYQRFINRMNKRHAQRQVMDNVRQGATPSGDDGYKSSVSTHSQKLDDLKKKYGRCQ